jgi:hypothetical protein
MLIKINKIQPTKILWILTKNNLNKYKTLNTHYQTQIFQYKVNINLNTFIYL